jgi:hypothetical protein
VVVVLLLLLLLLLVVVMPRVLGATLLLGWADALLPAASSDHQGRLSLRACSSTPSRVAVPVW